MPTYQYECESCGHHFERFQAMSDEKARSCPECSGPVQRLIAGGMGIISRGPDYECRQGCAARDACSGMDAPCRARMGACDGPVRG